LLVSSIDVDDDDEDNDVLHKMRLKLFGAYGVLVSDDNNWSKAGELMYRMEMDFFPEAFDIGGMGE
jgi:hypothetical protein